MMWAGGGARRSDDYDTPEGPVENSETRLTTGRAGVGYFGERLFTSGGFTLEDSRYGVPFAGEFHGEEDVGEEAERFVDIDSQRRVGRFDVGMQNVGTNMLDAFRVVVNVIDWGHDEIEIADGTERVGDDVQQPDLRRASRVRPASDGRALWHIRGLDQGPPLCGDRRRGTCPAHRPDGVRRVRV